MSAALIEEWFPALRASGYRVTSPADSAYNCVGWAADECDRRWWPDPLGIYYWPASVPRVLSPAAFQSAFALLGYAPASTLDLEPGREKVVVYVDDGGHPTHMARQLPDGNWTSKLGETGEDIEHDDLDGLRTVFYGAPTLCLARPRRA